MTKSTLRPTSKLNDEDAPLIRPVFRCHMATDVGVVRDHNEDCAYVDSVGDFFLCADGMGGHAAGEVASEMAVSTLRLGLEALRPQILNYAKQSGDAPRKLLLAAIEAVVRKAHEAVLERGNRELDKQGMGTTLDVLVLAGTEAFVAHVGDSRTYLFRRGKATRLTTDHTFAEVLVLEGKLSPEEAQISQLRAILVNAIGVSPEVAVELSHIPLERGDKLMLCSDGLHDYFPLDQELTSVIVNSSPEEALSKLVNTAKNRGGRDNITGIILEILDLPHDASEEFTTSETANMIQLMRADTAPTMERLAAQSKRQPRERKIRKPGPSASVIHSKHKRKSRKKRR